MVEHQDNTFGEGPVEIFGNSVLLQRSSDSAFVNDTTFGAPCLELVADEFTSLVVMEDFDLLASLGLNLGNKALELWEGVTLALEEVDLLVV